MRTELDKDDLGDFRDYSWAIAMGTKMLLLSLVLKTHNFSFDIKDTFRETGNIIGVSFYVKFNKKDFLLTIKKTRII
ncbi:hypothetical protein SB6419_00202 [Klebsiella spallanzanii]|nr:hypothetical protein SB6419_00202 [Klebsiella spallanzanii]